MDCAGIGGSAAWICGGAFDAVGWDTDGSELIGKRLNLATVVL
jgi:hypothetical protein